jgi:hypothetical protein
MQVLDQKQTVLALPNFHINAKTGQKMANFWKDYEIIIFAIKKYL